MTTVILVIHMMLAIALVITVLLQRSEGGGLGIGGSGGGGGMGGLMSVRGTANLLTRATAILAAGFMGTSITLAILANNTREPSSILDRPGMTGAPDAPVKEPVGVPLSK
ncbi:MAG: preprotein translocase subunit SecG [Alphaproteobacteria bacterium]|jgi:preprotein translocase subunit SecG|nr:preprotein translocase subunit SecG [Alphaproteobacteria bacterium]MDE0814324.1 preprotein translocase subunit SecG [Alphaproteobacteria bacterium]|tara:strand:- start:220 stop:549 length:330 start_codon:yes stop_codon:yes gene_type:complete